MRKVRIAAALAVLLGGATPLNAAEAATEPVTYYFHSGTPSGNADQVDSYFMGSDGNYMDTSAPTKSEPSVGSTVVAGRYPSFIYGPSWRLATAGTLTGTATVTFWAAPGATAFNVNLLTDEAIVDGYGPVAKKTVPASSSSGIAKYVVKIDNLNTVVQREIWVQITANTPVTNQLGPATVFYDSTTYPSSLTAALAPLPAPPPSTGKAYELYEAPGDFVGAHGPNELSIGVNPETNTAMMLMSLSTAAVTWDDTVSPPRATWKDVSATETSAMTLDPYLHTDRATGRTFALQLVGEHSLAAYTDDDGANWTMMDPPTTAPSFDHESLAAGPYPAGYRLQNPNPYGRAVYYCSQGLFTGGCTRSDDGGKTWNVPIQYSFLSHCSPSHGRVTVDHLGTLYLPVKSCGEEQGMFVSRDAGESWEQVVVPGTVAGNSDPAMALDGAGRVYYAASNAGGKLTVSTSSDAGRTFSAPVDVSTPAGVKLTEFAMATAGDAGRAAVAFYGAKKAGDSQDPEYTGDWHIYVATTVDGGQTWTTVDATPDSVVQRGWICLSGTSCDAGRNLLDFQGVTHDRDGRILVAYADGCTTKECEAAVGKNNADAESTDSLAVIARQMTGDRLTAPRPL